jgi:mannose-6-phosphate isomerase-like protein (cupin superfamily)
MKKGVIRNVKNNQSAVEPPHVEHEGLDPEEEERMKKIAVGYWLMRHDELATPIEYVNEFDCVGQVSLHSHHCDEFFYVLSGEGIMQIGDETDILVQPYDLIYTPPDVPHSIRPKEEGGVVRCFCFAVTAD